MTFSPNTPRVFVLALATGFFAPLAQPDSIVVDGKRYENVYIGVGATMYYIQDPADGSMKTVPKSKVDEADIQISTDRDARRRLRDQWKLRRLNRNEIATSTDSPSEWRESLDLPGAKNEELRQAVIDLDSPTEKNGIRARQRENGVIHFSNVDRGDPATGGRKMFMDRDGLQIMTNKPEEFRNRAEYIEVTIHYDKIDVPERFRRVNGLATAGPETGRLEDIVDYYANRYKLDPNLVFAVIRVESAGNPYAVSPAGARGLMQLMPGTAREMGVNDIFDPAENIAGGTQYLSKMLDLFDGNLTMALAGYNAGPGNVRKYGGVPPFRETQDYVRHVQRLQRYYARSGAPSFDVAGAKRVEQNYLPPESSEYYQILLDNGLTVAAEEVYSDGDRYIYLFEGRSGHFPETQVVAVYEPS